MNESIGNRTIKSGDKGGAELLKASSGVSIVGSAVAIPVVPVVAGYSVKISRKSYQMGSGSRNCSGRTGGLKLK